MCSHRSRRTGRRAPAGSSIPVPPRTGHGALGGPPARRTGGRRRPALSTLVWAALIAGPAAAELRVAPPFGDGMVLQRGAHVPVRGVPAPRAKVAVALTGPERVRVWTARAGADGRWRVELPPLEPGGPFELAVEAAGERLALRDVLIGRRLALLRPVEHGVVGRRLDERGRRRRAARPRALAGADRRFVWAEAAIEGERVVVRSERVPEPIAVRYAWADNPQGADLYNRAGLPASPFRTDSW